MLFPEAGIGGVVIGDDDGVVIYPQIAFQATEEVFGQMARIPLGKWLTQPCQVTYQWLIDTGKMPVGLLYANCA